MVNGVSGLHCFDRLDPNSHPKSGSTEFAPGEFGRDQSSVGLRKRLFVPPATGTAAAQINMHSPEALAKGDISILLGRGHFYFALTS
jgi:hypothetical protein